MPDFNTFKLSGTRLVPVDRFNLEPAKPSTTFSAATVAGPAVTMVNSPTAMVATPITMVNPAAFTVIAHPVLQSINVEPVILTTVNPAILFTPKEYFPIIDNSAGISENASFIDFTDKSISLVFPKVDITPNDNTLFYYEDVLDNKGNKSNSFLGRVMLKYTIKEPQLGTNQKYIPINLKEAVLNLKTKETPIKVNGIIDTAKKEIVFKIMDEAVKIAFLNLITNIDELKCNLDLFFDFKGYTKYRRNIFFAQQIHNLNHFPILNRDLSRFSALDKTETAVFKGKSTDTDEQIVNRSLIQRPLMVKANANERLVSKDTILEIQKDNNIETTVQAEYVKTTFLLKVNKILNYPLSTDKSTSVYKTVDGNFITNPFNLNEEFSQFKQIFVPGINFDKLSIYKSSVQPNTFLLVAKTYCLSRDLATTKPCITTIFHAFEEGTGLEEDISKIEFCFVLGPNLSDFDLAKLKIDLLINNFLDGDTSNYMDNIQFLYPNDIESNYEISGNYFLQKAEVSLDGKYFIFSITTEKLNEASLFINALNNSISAYANINFRHKEIKDTSIVDLNIEKSIGKTLNATFDNTTKKIKIENLSLSKCKINAALTIDELNANLFNSSFFSNYPLINSNESKELQHISLNPNLAAKSLKNVFFSFDYIEDISKEFNQIVATSGTYNKYIQIQIKTQKATVSKMQIELKVDATDSKFFIEKLKTDFKTPFLFNIITLNSAAGLKTISYKVNCFDKDNNILTTNNYVFDYGASSTIVIPKI
jgi:hypothetical protein